MPWRSRLKSSADQRAPAGTNTQFIAAPVLAFSQGTPVAPTSAALRRKGRPNWMLSVRVASSEYATSINTPNVPASVSQLLLSSSEACGLVSSLKSPKFALPVMPPVNPFRSRGLRVRRLTVPAMPPSIMSAEGFLKTSTPDISSAGTSSKLSPRVLRALNTSRPFSSLRTCVRPRTVTPLPSAEKRLVSLGANRWSMATPEILCSASVTLRSGSALMSTALIESTMTSAFCLISWEVWILWRSPVTTISVTGSVGACAAC